jgi:hypothetical protein
MPFDTTLSRATTLALNVLTSVGFLALAWVTPYPWGVDTALTLALVRLIRWEERDIIDDPRLSTASKTFACALDLLAIQAFIALAWFTPFAWYTDTAIAVAVIYVIGGPELGQSPEYRRHGVL